ncbi:MAG: DNA internalization-related competence protein ComEC/Rec2 [Pseudomonadota bacterium]
MRSSILAFIAGVWLLQQQPVLPDLAWMWGLPLLASTYWLPRRGWLSALRHGLLLGTLFGAGFLFAAAVAEHRMQDALPQAWEGMNVALIGVVASLPVKTEHGQRFEFDVEHVNTPGAHIPRHIQLNTYTTTFNGKPLPDAPRVHAGERWSFTVRLRRPHANANPHVFDMEAWFLERNLRALGHVRDNPDNRRLSDFVWRPDYVVEAMRETIALRIDRVLAGEPYAGVLKALVIGDQSAIPPAQWVLYQRTGITHLVSISGLHVTMLSGLAFALMYWLWRRSVRLTSWLPARRAAVLAGALVAFLYVLLAGFAVPAQRTFYMLLVVALALWSGRVIAPTRVLSWALLTVVLLDPWAVLSAGFWLSFGAVAAMLFATTARVGKPHWLRAWLTTQWAVTLALAPVLLLLFGQLSLVSPLANAFAIPLVSFGVTPLALAGSIPGMDWLLYAAHWLMAAGVWALNWLAHLPLALWQQPEPSTLAVLLALLGALWLLLPRGFPARWLGAVLILPALLTPSPRPAPGALWVSVLDVGQGLAVLVRTAHHAVLFDTGPRYTAESDSGSRIIVPYLRGEGVARLDGLIVSHDDNDHSGGAVSVLHEVPVDWFASSLPASHPAQAAGVRSLRCVAGQHWQWDGVRFAMLYPTAASYDIPRLKDNNRSCVLKIDSAGGSALLSADIEARDEAWLLNKDPDQLAATLLVAPHHGSRTSSTPDFIAAVHPAITVFTVGYRNRYGHPRGDVVARYARQGGQLMRSDYNGAVEMRFAADHSPVLIGWRQTRMRYWQAAVR